MSIVTRRIAFLVTTIFIFEAILAGLVIGYGTYMAIPYKDYVIPLLTSFVMPVVSVIALVIFPSILREEDKQEASTREQRQYALELFRTLMGSEFYVKARLITQEYLLPPGDKYTQFRGLDFDEINAILVNPIHPSGTPKTAQELARDLEARTCIRAVTNFFWLVHQAKERQLIAANETLFAESYAWYWVHIISLHIKKDMRSQSAQFKPFDWMTNRELVEKFQAERLQRYQNEPMGAEKMLYSGTAPW